MHLVRSVLIFGGWAEKQGEKSSGKEKVWEERIFLFRYFLFVRVLVDGFAKMTGGDLPTKVSDFWGVWGNFLVV